MEEPIFTNDDMHRIDLQCAFPWNCDHLQSGKEIMINTLDLENTIIACILLDGELYLPSSQIISDADFTDNICKIIYRAMKDLYIQDIPIDIILLINYLECSDITVPEHIIFALKDFMKEVIVEIPNRSHFNDYVLALRNTRLLEKEREKASILNN